MQYKNIFLDFDDTLVDTQGYATKCLKQMYVDFSLNRYFRSVDDFLCNYHKHTRTLWEDYSLGKIDKATLIKERFEKPFTHVSDIDLEFLTHMNASFMERVVHIDDIIYGAVELLDYLKSKGYNLLIISNGFTEVQYQKIKNVGFEGYFDHIVLSDEIGVNKPHPEIFEKALEMVGGTTSDTIMIGDSYLADIKGAIDSGMDQIWYNPLHEKAPEKPTHTVYELLEIKDIL